MAKIHRSPANHRRPSTHREAIDPMRYQVRQKLLSFGPTFDIANEAGETVLRAKGAAMAFSADIRIESLGGHEFVRVQQQLFAWRPTYHLTRGGEPLATVTRRIAWRPTLWVDLASGARLVVTGSFWQHEYQFAGPTGPVAQASRSQWSLRDHYGVEVLDPSLEAIVLGSVIAIDCVRANANRNS